jgi:hypothetical protein
VANSGDSRFGAPDLAALRAIRETILRVERLAEATVDDPLNPSRLVVDLPAGIEEPGRFEVRWSTTGYHGFHYEEPDLAFRFDRHPNPHSLEKHVHLPPDGEATERSCIEVERPELVALAVLERWRAAVESGVESLNDGENPP